MSHQYKLTHEQGPAHEKCFTVTLTLGTEEYTADGASIKKAQHAAAAVALSKTSYPHPAPKTNRTQLLRGSKLIKLVVMWTVDLASLSHCQPRFP